MKKKLIYIIGSIVLMLVLAYGFVPQVLGGKIVNQSDISGWQGMSHEMMEWNAAHPDDQTAWTESMFGGMPTATIHASTKGDWTQWLYDLLLTGKRPATYYFISLLGACLLMLAFGVHPLLALGGEVLWAVGIGSSETAKLRSGEKALRFEYIEKKSVRNTVLQNL